MSNWNKQYLKLLYDQVQDELSFLNAQGHKLNSVTEPCIFCVKNMSKPDSYHCNRVKSLQAFLGEITVKISTNGSPTTERRTIGQPIESPRESILESKGINPRDLGLLPETTIDLKLLSYTELLSNL